MLAIEPLFYPDVFRQPRCSTPIEMSGVGARWRCQGGRPGRPPEVVARGGAEVVSDLRPEHRSGIFCFRPPHAERAFQALSRAGVACVLREGAIRLSPHLYNTQDEIAVVMEVLSRPEGW